MGSMNRVTLVGRLGADPELKTTTSSRQVVNFRMATDESYTDTSGERQEKTEWHRIVAWQRTAELVHQYLSKGSQVLVEGRLQTRKWQDKEGNDRYSTEIVAFNVQFLGSKRDDVERKEAA